jgi:hypothetical protein
MVKLTVYGIQSTVNLSKKQENITHNLKRKEIKNDPEVTWLMALVDKYIKNNYNYILQVQERKTEVC